jgi:GntR family transcriptional regulator
MPSTRDVTTPLGPGPAPLDRSAATPLWAQLQADLRRRLEAGEFASSFPGEHGLAEQYAVSRQTVREALRLLRTDGLVVAGRGRAPRLAQQPQFSQPLGALYSLFSSVEAGGHEQHSEVRRLEVTADGVVAARLGREESTPLVHLERLRFAGPEPLALDRVWLPAEVAQPLLDADFTRTGLYDELVARCGLRLQTGQEQIRAVVATAAERRTLQIGTDVALLAIDRTGWVGGTAVEWRQTLVRGDRFAVTATLGIGPQVTLGGRHHPSRPPLPRRNAS